MKKTISILFAALFLLLCLIPSAGLAVFGTGRAGSNEILTAAPSLTNKDGTVNTGVLSDASDWFGDHFALRLELITLRARLQAALLGTSADEDVVLGNKGWLYYGKTLEDYAGKGLTEGELRMLANNLALLQEYAEKNGAAFLFTSAPNKNSLYPEQMPGRIAGNHGQSNLARLPEALTEAGVSYADLYAALSGAERSLYYKTDTHWTPEGAALGADTILAALGKAGSYADLSSRAEGLHLGDLYEMLYPAAKTGTEPELVADYVFGYTTEKDPKGGDALKINTHNPAAEGKLMCWRDSFGIALYPYLAESFGEAFFSRSESYDLISALEEGYDSIVIELVERNLGKLLTNLPVFPAPEREVPAATLAGEALTVTETAASGSAKDAGLKLVSVSLPESCAGANGCRVYVAAGDTCYEAYILVTEDGSSAQAYVPEDFVTEQVLVAAGDAVTAHGVQ